MKKALLLFVLLAGVFSTLCYSQKKFGYAVLYMRCGKNEPQKNQVYYSPVIELNVLNFNKYTDGVDPAIPKYSVRYYTYAIDKWFEIYLKDKYEVLVNDPDKYERNATSVIFDEQNKARCNDDKTSEECFFSDKEKIAVHRKNAIAEARLPIHQNEYCGVAEM
ncbi:MAG: hypothetical protein ABIN94_00920 [Ferruginibacter sp.]